MSIVINEKNLTEKKKMFVIIHVDEDSIESTSAMTKEEVDKYIFDLIRASEYEEEADKLKIFKFDWDVDQDQNDYFVYENKDEEYRMEFKIFEIKIESESK